jgi:hypothetical protein
MLANGVFHVVAAQIDRAYVPGWRIVFEGGRLV